METRVSKEGFKQQSPDMMAQIIRAAAEKNEIPESISGLVALVREQVGCMSETFRNLDTTSISSIFFAVRTWVSEGVRESLQSILGISNTELEMLKAGR